MRLSKETQDRIIALYKDGTTWDSIVAMTGVTKHSVNKVVSSYEAYQKGFSDGYEKALSEMEKSTKKDA